MALTQPPRKRTRVWPTTVVGVLALLTALLALPLTLARHAEGYVYWTNHDAEDVEGAQGGAHHRHALAAGGGVQLDPLELQGRQGVSAIV